MSDDPNDWYRERLQRKLEAEARAAIINFFLMRLLAVAAVAALVIIAIKL